jgi:hypothetical protein
VTELDLPTIRNLRDCLSALIDRGLGDLPVQIVVAPDSTMQALARAESQGADDEPALMIEYPREGQWLGVPFISTDRLSRGGMPSYERY